MIDCENCIHVQMCKWCDEMVKTHTCDYYETYDSFEPKRPHGEWIPCAERLPEVYGVYLATNSEGDVYEYDYSEFTVHDGKWSFLGRDVIAWMPLPKPYKKEGEGN